MTITNRLPTSVRHHLAALRALLVFTVIVGIAYPLVVTAIGQLVFHNQANGSLIERNGQIVGSSLLGQAFVDAQGNPLPQWFQPRPSAAVNPANSNDPGYNPLFSAASNLGPSNPVLLKEINDRRAAVAAFDGVLPAAVPADALTASGSGLDPDISPAYAYEQADRVATTRHLDPATVRALVTDHIQGRNLGFLGEPRVNVVELNLALGQLGGQA
ncbi:MAG TPA: potassium-transporting ATPase subunit KdpC [Pseudonocardia sp.]|uniref:potassium-transporting ATPase subunit KdpC n=1 Tax=Pseudonocardia sp. TaxID=60912 RepID=UPI002C71B0B3|nr:potassium-transporting ATPase subunit KdpC [Pseudonocardia sp.]HTF52906.1 potassium-transporting ATPase subunit KdpC [Pseudonocardia sp.]